MGVEPAVFRCDGRLWFGWLVEWLPPNWPGELSVMDAKRLLCVRTQNGLRAAAADIGPSLALRGCGWSSRPDLIFASHGYEGGMAALNGRRARPVAEYEIDRLVVKPLGSFVRSNRRGYASSRALWSVTGAFLERAGREPAVVEPLTDWLGTVVAVRGYVAAEAGCPGAAARASGVLPLRSADGSPRSPALLASVVDMVRRGDARPSLCAMCGEPVLSTRGAGICKRCRNKCVGPLGPTGRGR